MHPYYTIIFAILHSPYFPLVLLLTGFALVFLAGYRAEKKGRSFAQADIKGEIVEIILENKPDADFRSFKVATFIAIKLQIANDGPATVSVIDWSLEVQVGNVRAAAKRIDIPPQARMRRSATPFAMEHIAPLDPLDKKCRETPLRHNIPLEGWLLFELPTREIPDPKNGRLRVLITDSLSQTHEIIREASPFINSGNLIWQE